MNAAKYLAGAFLVVVYLLSQADLLGGDDTTAALGVLLLLLCLWPAIAWALSGMHNLPLFEVYSFMHLIYYWLPASKADGEVMRMDFAERTTVLGAICLYLICGQLAYFGLLRQLRARQSGGWQFLSNRVSLLRGGLLPWTFLFLVLGYHLAAVSGVLWDFVSATTLPFVRSFCGVCGLLGIFVLGRQAGEKILSQIQTILFASCVAMITAVSFASGYLGVGTVFVGNAFFAYTIGARRLPAVALTAFLILLSFMNYGKAEMRARYWESGESTTDFVELYSFWFESSWQELKTPQQNRAGAAMSALERARLAEVFSRIVVQTPQPVPYLDGRTYLDSLQLFIPRILWPERPDLNTIMNQLGLRYGIHQNQESTQETNISLGQIAEAWANGGWLAVALVGAFFGCLFHLGVRTAYGRETDTVGFLFGMTLVGLTVNLEQLTGTVLMIFYQSAVVCLFLLYLLSRRVITRLIVKISPELEGASSAPRRFPEQAPIEPSR